MNINGLAHVMLGVTDLEASRAFYCGALGLAVQREAPGFLFLDTGAVTLCLSEPHATLSEHPGPTEVVLAVDHVRQAYDALRANGVEFMREPVNVTGTAWAANFRDPDGHLLSVFGPE